MYKLHCRNIASTSSNKIASSPPKAPHYSITYIHLLSFCFPSIPTANKTDKHPDPPRAAAPCQPPSPNQGFQSRHAALPSPYVLARRRSQRCQRSSNPTTPELAESIHPPPQASAGLGRLQAAASVCSSAG